MNLLKNVKFHYSIPMRYHSLLFSFIQEIPFFPIFSTSKIYRFLKDIDWQYQYYSQEGDFELKEILKKLNHFSNVCLEQNLKIKLCR